MNPTTLTAARTLLEAWRGELYLGHVNQGTGQVDDADVARDIAEIDRVVAELEALAQDPDEAPMGSAERWARRALCAAYAGGAAYMDDGEAQDNRAEPWIDFLRDTPAAIDEKMRRRGGRQGSAAWQSSAADHSEIIPDAAQASGAVCDSAQVGKSADDLHDGELSLDSALTLPAEPRVRDDVRKARDQAIDAVTEALLHDDSGAAHGRALAAIEHLASLAAEPFQ